MKFGEAMPDVKVGESASPHIHNSGRIFPCAICKELTGWRDNSLGVEVPICSDDCKDVLDEQQAEAAKEESSK